MAVRAAGKQVVPEPVLDILNASPRHDFDYDNDFSISVDDIVYVEIGLDGIPDHFDNDLFDKEIIGHITNRENIATFR